MANTFKFGNGEWAVGKETALAYNDENSNFKPLPFTFDRASTATVVNKQGLIETVGIDEPRIDFLNNTKGHLLLEPQRQNVITYSEFDSASPANWQTGFGTGTFSYDLVSYKSRPALKQRQQTEGRSYKAQNVTVSTSTTYTFSFYIDKENSLNMNDNDIVCAVISSDDIGFSSRNYGDADENNRRNFTFTTNTDTSIQIRIGLGASGNQAGDKTLIFSMPQLEAGSYATSYIPTQGSAATRSVDFTKIVNSPILQGTNQFTLFFEAKDFLIVNGTNVSFSNLMLVFGAGESAYDSGTGIHIYDRTWFYYNGSSAVHVGVCYNGLVDSKFAISYDGTKFTRYAGGVKLGEYTASASMVNWDTITTGANTDVENDDRVFNLSDLRLYNTALTDAELIALTS